MNKANKKITWLQNFDNDHRDSVWYGGAIVSIKIAQYKITISAIGDVRLWIGNEHYVDKCNGGRMRQFLEENGIRNDEDLQFAIASGKVVFEDNNWYEFSIYDTNHKCYVDCEDTIIDDELDREASFNWLIDYIDDIIYEYEGHDDY